MQFVKDPDCKNDHWRIEELDALVCSQVDALASSGSALDRVLAEASTAKKAVIDKSAIRRRVAEIDGQVAKLIDLYQVSAIPMETVTARVEALSTERTRLQEQLDIPEDTPASALFMEALDTYRSSFKDSDMPRKRLLLASLIERVTIDGQSVALHWRL